MAEEQAERKVLVSIEVRNDDGKVVYQEKAMVPESENPLNDPMRSQPQGYSMTNRERFITSFTAKFVKEMAADPTMEERLTFPLEELMAHTFVTVHYPYC